MRTSRRVSRRASSLVIPRDIQCENQLETWPVFTPFLIPSRHWSKLLGCKIKIFINIRITLIWSRSLGCLVPRVSCSRHFARAVLPASWACLCRRELDASCVVDISIACSRYDKNCCCYCCCTEWRSAGLVASPISGRKHCPLCDLTMISLNWLRLLPLPRYV